MRKAIDLSPRFGALYAPNGPGRWPFSDVPLNCGMRLNQITAPATDLEASIAFYCALGLKLIVRSAHYARFEAPNCEATFSLHLVTGGIAHDAAPQIYFECDDLGADVLRLKRAGIAFETEPTLQPWLWTEAWLRDPAGNHLCLFHAGENRRNPPWRLPD